MFRNYKNIMLDSGCTYIGMFMTAVSCVGLCIMVEKFEKMESVEGMKPISVLYEDVNSDGISDLIIETSNGRKFTFEGQEDGRYKGLEEFLQKN